jgi:hypothetical protein
MKTRENLHGLVDALPEEYLSKTHHLLECMLQKFPGVTETYMNLSMLRDLGLDTIKITFFNDDLWWEYVDGNWFENEEVPFNYDERLNYLVNSGIEPERAEAIAAWEKEVCKRGYALDVTHEDLKDISEHDEIVTWEEFKKRIGWDKEESDASHN